jgi:hypothetical protein
MAVLAETLQPTIVIANYKIYLKLEHYKVILLSQLTGINLRIMRPSSTITTGGMKN